MRGICQGVKMPNLQKIIKIIRGSLLQRQARSKQVAAMDRLRSRVAREMDFRCITITVPDESKACAAVRACADQRFLTSDPPHLPLANCDAPECHCVYTHYLDRRHLPRRYDDRRLPGLSSRSGGRRADADRRTDEEVSEIVYTATDYYDR